MTDFFVVQTHPQREAFVEDRLCRLSPYLPRFKTRTGRIAPLFPSYLFVPVLDEWGRIARTEGVRRVLMATGTSPAIVREKTIVGLRERERGGLVQLPPPPRFARGERLVILRGSLRYRTATYAGMAGRDRERVLLDMLGQTVTLTIPTDDLISEGSPQFRRRLRR